LSKFIRSSALVLGLELFASELKRGALSYRGFSLSGIAAMPIASEFPLLVIVLQGLALRIFLEYSFSFIGAVGWIFTNAVAFSSTHRLGFGRATGRVA